MLRICFTLAAVAAAGASAGFSGHAAVRQAAGSAAVVITNATVIDGTGAPPRRGQSVLLKGNRIAAIGADVRTPADARLIDGTGKFVVPGLIDTHAHLDFPMVFQLSPAERDAVIAHVPKALLYNGVTTVLNLSAQEEWIWQQRAAQRAGRLLAPRIYAMGRSFTPVKGWGSRHGGALASIEDARAQARRYIAEGTDGFKIVIEDGLGGSGQYAVMSDGMLKAIVDEAHRAKVPMYVHAINIGEFRVAARINPRAIVHGLEDPLPDNDPLLKTLVDHRIYVVPTISLFEAFNRFDGHPELFDDPVLKASLPDFLWQNMQRPDYMAVEKKRFAEVARMDAYVWAEKALPIFKANTLKMHRAGVKIAVGTDAGGTVGYNFQGYNTPRELELLVESGLTPMEALVAATRTGAEVIGVQETLGTIEAGKLADLLILSADPTTDIRNVRHIDTVVQNGVVYPRQAFAYSK